MPGVPIPVICSSPFCGAVFFIKNLVFDPTGYVPVFVTRSTAGPCPNCGGQGDIPNGTYTVFDSVIHDDAAAIRVAKAMSILQRHIEQPTSLVVLMNELSEVGLKPKGWTPKNLQEALSVVTIILSVLTFLYTIYKDQKPAPPPTAISTEMKEVIELLIDSSRHTSPPKDQTVRPPISVPAPPCNPYLPPTK